MKKLLTKNRLLILLILGLAAFFRFYKFYQFQYFGGDEAVLTASLRHIIWDRSPSLIVPNANLGFGLGPFYYYLLTPFFYIFKFDLPNLQAIASILGIITTYLVYLGGKEVGGKKLGLTASFLYATSFFIALFDRRLVHLTLDPILTGIAFYSLVKVVKKNYQYIPLLAIPIGFSFHADPSLLVLVIAIVLSWIIFKLPVKNKYFFRGLLVLAVFASPLVLAEIYYQGAVSKPIIQSLSRPFDSTFAARQIDWFKPMELINTLARVLFAAPSAFIEEHFCYCKPPLPLFRPLSQILVIVGLVVSLLIQLRNKKSQEKKSGWILWIMCLSLMISIYIYNQIFKADFFQHYLMVFFPVVIIILARPLVRLHKKMPFIFYLLMVFYLTINFSTLLKSSVKYPLRDKINLIKQTGREIGESDFSIKAAGIYVHGGGWTELYNHYFKPAVKSYLYDYWGWIYAAYSLYPGPMQTEQAEKIVYFHLKDELIDHQEKIISSFTLNDIQVDMLDNTNDL